MRNFLWALALLTSPLAFANDCATLPEAEQAACTAPLYRQAIEHWPAPNIDADVNWQEMAALPARAPSPPENPFSEAKAELGQQLFFDPTLSRSGQIACASCHEPDLAFADGRRVSFGHDRQAGKRNAPSLVMAGYTHKPFWDGRTGSLEEQALHPVEDPVEMAFTTEDMVKRLQQRDDYQAPFTAAFGSPEVTAERVAFALATYQRTLVSRTQNTPFEQFLRGRYQFLNDQQVYGLHLFRTQARCMNCHFGPALTDDEFHNLGLTYYGRKFEDLGRYLVTGQAADVGKFRTPSLRLVMSTKPWMHNGLFVNMKGTLALYNRGMARPQPTAAQTDDPLFPHTSERLKVLNLSPYQLDALLAFLQTL